MEHPIGSLRIFRDRQSPVSGSMVEVVSGVYFATGPVGESDEIRSDFCQQIKPLVPWPGGRPHGIWIASPHNLFPVDDPDAVPVNQAQEVSA